MDKAREDMLFDCWANETNEPWTQEWRDDLTPEEEALVETWDRKQAKATLNTCTKILILDEIQKAYGKVLELEEMPEGYRVRLQSGGLYLATLSMDHTLRMTEIDPAC